MLSAALYARFRSRQDHAFGEKMLSAMRLGFGGHVEGRSSIRAEPAPIREPLDKRRGEAMSDLDKPQRRNGGAHDGRAAAPRSPADPCAMVLFGATGDLTHRLVIPALYNLSRTGASAGAIHADRRGAGATSRPRTGATTSVDSLKNFVGAGSDQSDGVDAARGGGSPGKCVYVAGRPVQS